MLTIRILLIFLILSISSQSSARETIVLSQGKIENSIFLLMAKRTLTEAYSRIGIDVQYESVPNQRSIINANTGSVDGLLARIAGLEKDYSNLTRIPIPIAYDEILVYSKIFDFKVEGWRSLAPYKIGYVNGFKRVENKTRGMDVERVSSPIQGLQKLNRGRTDVFIGVQGIKCLINSLKLTEITAIDKPIEEITLYHYLNKSHSEKAVKIEAVLKEMLNNGELTAIQTQAKQDFLDLCR